MIENFNIPNSCKVGKKLFKKQFIENFSLNINEKKLLSEIVDSITLEYLLNKDNINILPFTDEEKDYSEIAFVKVEILSQDKLKQISNIIQNIPYPLIVVFVYQDFIALNLSPKRINKADSSKLVVEESYFTNWVDTNNLSSLEEQFLENLDIKRHPFTDFLSLYNSYLDKIIAFNASEYSGILSANEKTKDTLNEIRSIELTIEELKSKIKKETNFNDKVNLNVQLKKMNDNLDELKGRI